MSKYDITDPSDYFPNTSDIDDLSDISYDEMRDREMLKVGNHKAVKTDIRRVNGLSAFSEERGVWWHRSCGKPYDNTEDPFKHMIQLSSWVINNQLNPREISVVVFDPVLAYVIGRYRWTMENWKDFKITINPGGTVV